MPSEPIPPDADCYFGQISREEANKMLHDQPSGTFLLRDSTTRLGYVLADKTTDKVLHYLINYSTETGQFVCTDKAFDSFDQLIDWFINAPCKANNTKRRRRPAPKPILQVTCKDFVDQQNPSFQIKRGDKVQFINQKAAIILCRNDAGLDGRVPCDCFEKLTSPLQAATRRNKPNSPSQSLSELPYCRLGSDLLQFPCRARVIQSRLPSMFLPNHLELKTGDSLLVTELFPDGFCLARNESSSSRSEDGLAPVSCLDFNPTGHLAA